MSSELTSRPGVLHRQGDLPAEVLSPPSAGPIPLRVTRAERKAATRQRILGAARKVFFRDGFMDTSLDEVASLASIGKGTLYRHFESKAELYVAVLMEGGDYFEQRMTEALAPDADALTQLRRLGGFYRDFWSRFPEYFHIFWAIHNQATIGDLPAPLLEQVKGLWERPLRQLEEVIRQGVEQGQLLECDPWVMANVIWNMGNSGFEAIIAPDKSRLVECAPDAMYDAGLELLLRGLTQA